MKIAVTGASGLIGSALVPALRADGHEVIQLVRRTPRTADEHRWDPQHRRIDPTLLADVDAVVNLAGTPIRPRPWTRGYKERLLAQPARRTDDDQRGAGRGGRRRPGPAPVLLSGSAVGYYGDTGARPSPRRTRRAPTSSPRLCAQWEAATAPAEAAGVRVAQLRTGLVHRPQGDADAGHGPGLPARPRRPAGLGPAVLAVDQPAPTRSPPSGTC